MIHSITFFPKSIDPEEADRIISNLAVSLQSAPGFRSLWVSDGALMSPGGPPSYSKVIESSFESLEEFMAWVNSPQVQSPEAQADKDYMIDRGTIMLFYEVKEL